MSNLSVYHSSNPEADDPVSSMKSALLRVYHHTTCVYNIYNRLVTHLPGLLHECTKPCFPSHAKTLTYHLHVASIYPLECSSIDYIRYFTVLPRGLCLYSWGLFSSLSDPPGTGIEMHSPHVLLVREPIWDPIFAFHEDPNIAWTRWDWNVSILIILE